MGGKESKERRRKNRSALNISRGSGAVEDVAGKINKVRELEGSESTGKKREKKIIKPKHLKRKFEQLAHLEGEEKEEMREKLIKEQDVLEKQKAKRSIAFETKIQETVGVASFNKKVFDNLISRGVSKSKIVEAIISETKPTESKLSNDNLINTDSLETSTISIILTKENQDENNDDSISSIDRDAAPKEDPSKDIDRTSTDGESNSDSDTYLEADNKLRKRSRGRRHISKKSKVDALDLVSTAGPESEKTITVSRTVNHKETIAPSEKQVDTRRCIGRKPVTDFVIGNTYKGKVVYVKPFGAFIDIGCHSDGFVHVSRVHDDFVEDINSVLKEGDEVKARIVEIDRKGRRMTLSLQSSEMIEREVKSLEGRLERLEKKKFKKKALTSKKSPMTKSSNFSEITKKAERDYTATDKATNTPADNVELSKAELKRNRKIERRLQRRLVNEKN